MCFVNNIYIDESVPRLMLCYLKWIRQRDNKRISTSTVLCIMVLRENNRKREQSIVVSISLFLSICEVLWLHQIKRVIKGQEYSNCY